MKIIYAKRPGLKLIYRALLSAVILAILLPSCIKKEDFDFSKMTDFDWRPNGAAPLIHSTLTLREILNDFDNEHLVTEDSTHFLLLVYGSTVFSQRADSLINITDQSVNSSTSFSTGAIPVNDSSITSYVANYTFTTSNSERYDSIEFKSGYLQFNLNGNINHNARIYITIPSATKGGQVFRKTILYNYSGSLPVIINDTFNLNGYMIGFTAGNQVAVNYSIATYGDINPDNSPYNVSMGESFVKLKFRKIFGYLGQYTFNFGQNNVPIDLFKNNFEGTMFFEDPVLHVYATNGFGMPMVLNFSTLTATSAVNPPFIVPIAIPAAYNPWNVPYPSFLQIGQNVVDSFSLDKTNSNFKTAVNMSPSAIDYMVDGLSNPAGNPLTDQNFVLDTSIFKIDVIAELPLYGYASDFVLQDTMEFGFGSDIDQLEWIRFKINTLNGFPVDATMQVYFADSNYVVLDSLLVPLQQVITGGIIGPPDNKVISPTYRHVETVIGSDRIAGLDDTKYMFIKATLATSDNGGVSVRFYSDYNLDVKIGAQAQLKIHVD